jgi:hypothetical protein
VNSAKLTPDDVLAAGLTLQRGELVRALVATAPRRRQARGRVAGKEASAAVAEKTTKCVIAQLDAVVAALSLGALPTNAQGMYRLLAKRTGKTIPAVRKALTRRRPDFAAVYKHIVATHRKPAARPKLVSSPPVRTKRALTR